jgi:hypothetical protein
MEFFGILRCAQDDSTGDGDALWESKGGFPLGMMNKNRNDGRGK